MDNDLVYEPQDETIEIIEYDFLENAYVDNIGNTYKTLDDIPTELRHLVS
jgi:hypothetical protein